MIVKTLYRYEQDGVTIDSLQQPDCGYLERFRLIADENMLLTQDEETFFVVIDVDKEDVHSWKEVPIPEGMVESTDVDEPEVDTVSEVQVADN